MIRCESMAICKGRLEATIKIGGRGYCALCANPLIADGDVPFSLARSSEEPARPLLLDDRTPVEEQF